MATSTDGEPATVASPPSSPSASPPSAASRREKLELAHQAAMVQDNRELLGLTLDTNRQLRRQGLRLREAQMATAASPSAEAVAAGAAESEAMGNILIDSPTTTNNHYPAAAAVPATVATVAAPAAPPATDSSAPSLLSRALPWLAALGLGAGGLFVGKALNGTAPSTPTPVIQKSSSGFLIELVEPKK